MQTTSILPSPLGVETDGGSQAATALGSRVQRAVATVWPALEAAGRARALRELRALHGNWETSDAEFTRQLRDGSLFQASSAHPHR